MCFVVPNVTYLCRPYTIKHQGKYTLRSFMFDKISLSFTNYQRTLPLPVPPHPLSITFLCETSTTFTINITSIINKILHRYIILNSLTYDFNSRPATYSY